MHKCFILTVFAVAAYIHYLY